MERHEDDGRVVLHLIGVGQQGRAVEEARERR
jgi:hypothetical protein